VRARAALGPGDAVPGGEPFDPGAEGEHGAGTLLAEHPRVGPRVHALAVVDVDEVHSRGLDRDERLPGARLGLGQLDEGELFGPARGLDADGSHGSTLGTSGRGIIWAPA